MIAQWRRRDGELELATLREEIHGFFVALRVDGSFLFEAGQEFAHGARIEERTGEAMLADFASLLEDIDVLFAELPVGILGVVLVDELR